MWLLVFLALFCSREPAPRLTAKDRALLEGLIGEVLFDPRGAERVVCTWLIPMGPDRVELRAEGWWANGRLYSIDGAPIFVPPTATRARIDFIAASRRRHGLDSELAISTALVDDDPNLSVGQNLPLRDLVRAAWLFRLGEEAGAAHALRQALNNWDPGLREKLADTWRPRLREKLRTDLADIAYRDLRVAFATLDDVEAVACGARFQARYGDLPAEAEKAPGFAQVPRIVADLKRRESEGRLGQAPAESPPLGFEDWSAERKASYWIARFDEIDNSGFRDNGNQAVTQHGVFQALVALEDPAMPALIDALEKDSRLTRYCWADRGTHPFALSSVREVAVQAIAAILKTGRLDPWTDEVPARSLDEAPALWAGRLRAFWRDFGKLPFDERMMKILTDPRATAQARLDAASNLTNLGGADSVWVDIRSNIFGEIEFSSGESAPPKPNPCIAKFCRPTTAEATMISLRFIFTSSWLAISW